MRTLLENLREDEDCPALQGPRGLKWCGRWIKNDIGQAIYEIERLEKLVRGWRSFKDDPPGADLGMIIYKKARNHDGRHPIGIAYRTVSKTWNDSCSFSVLDIVEWMPLPEA